MSITPLQMMKVCPSISLDTATKISNALNEVCPLYKMDTPDILHEFIANIAHESGCFQKLEENLNYRAERLMYVWPHRFRDIETAKKYEHNPRAIAERVYGSRKDLGNDNAADGWVFRGGGFIQLTGRMNYTLFLNYYNNAFEPKLSLPKMADLIRTDFKYAMHSACWFFAISKKLIPLAINDNLKAIVLRINGGLFGLNDRTFYYERAKKHIV